MSTSSMTPTAVPASVRLHRGRWHVIMNNEIRRTFAGLNASRYAADMALYFNSPTLARLVAGFLKVCPALWKTAHRAADLLLRQHLTAHVPTGTRTKKGAVATVRSGTRPGTSYTLRADTNGTLSCTCPGFGEQPFYGPAGKPFCKHLLAYVFHLKSGQPLPPAPTPAQVWDRLQAHLQATLQPATWHKLFMSAVLSPRSTLTTMRLTVSDQAVATLLNHPQWQTALHRTATGMSGYPVAVRVTVRRTTRSTPALTLVSTPSVAQTHHRVA